MKIPHDAISRERLYQELLRQCLVSRSDRFTLYKQLRNYYLFGSANGDSAPYNKIGSTVETLCSFMYAPDSTKFSLHLGETAKDEIGKVPPMSRELNDNWRMTEANLNFGLGIKWSLVFGTMLFKPLWKRGLPRPYLVEPHQFGVLREDVTSLADQQAFVHCYTTTKAELETELLNIPTEMLSAEKRNRIFESVGKGAGENQTMFSEGMSRLITPMPAVGGVTGSRATNQSGSSVGSSMTSGSYYDYTPQVEVDLIDMFELYVWNDDIEDFQMVTLASPDVVVFDRRQPGIPGVPGFVPLRPELNCYDYFWGESFVARLTKLQDWRSERVLEIRKILGLQADPSWTLSGFGGIAEEKLAGLKNRGGMVSANMPGAKADRHAPTMPPNTFTELTEIDRMFDDTAGIGHILQGKGEPGVRSKGQADLMARLGSARPKQRAIVIESAAENLAGLMLRLIQQHSKQRFVPEGGEKNHDASTLYFIPAQFTNDYEVRVDAHSSSPIFVEDRKHDAQTLLEAHAINRKRFLEMMDPPGLQTLLEELKEIEAKEAQAAQQEQMQQQAKGAGK
jgi:hypothetical protein